MSELQILFDTELNVACVNKEKIIKMIPAGKPAGIFLSLKNSSYCMCTQKIPENPEMQKERN